MEKNRVDELLALYGGPLTWRERLWNNTFRYALDRLKDIWYTIKCVLWHRFHIVNVRGQDGQGFHWVDADRLLLLASFKILCDFIEKEKPDIVNETVDDYGGWGENDCDREMLTWQLEGNAELVRLWRWWKEIRPVEHAALMDLPPDDWKSWRDEETRLYEKDNEMLCRLAKARLRMWS